MNPPNTDLRFGAPPNIAPVYQLNSPVATDLRFVNPNVQPVYVENANAGSFNVLSYGARGDGVTDDYPAIQATITAAQNAGGGIVFLPNLPFGLLNGLQVTAQGVTILGAGRWATTLTPLAGFTGAAVISATNANGITIAELGIKGASNTYSLNPACDGIDITTCYVAHVSDLYIAFMNGWGLVHQTSVSADAFSPCFHNVFITRGAGGFHVKGFAGHTSIGAVFTNCAGDQAQVNEAFLLEDAVDVQLANCGGYSLGSGISCVHVKGGGFITCTSGDFGATNPGVGPCVLIESGATGSPNAAIFTGNVIEKGSVGVSITAGTDHIIGNNLIYFNQTHGISITGGAGVDIIGNAFDGNGQAGGAGHYDVFQNTGSGNPVHITGNVFRTGQGTGVGQVAQAIHPNSTATQVVGNHFIGATGANALSGPAGYAANNPGYNPVGPLTPPAVPASTVAQTNTFGVSVVVYVTGGTVSAVAVGGTATGLTSGAFRVGPGQTITLTYTVAPTWTWYGD